MSASTNQELQAQLAREQAARQAFEQRTAFFDQLMHGLPAGVAFFDTDICYRFVNETYARITLNQPPAFYVDRPIADVLPDAAGETEALLRGVATTGEPWKQLAWPIMLQRDGKDEQTYWEFEALPLRARDGAILGVLVWCTESTERVRLARAAAEQARALEESHLQLQAQVRRAEESEAGLERQKLFAESIVQNVPAGICYLDRELVYRVVNPLMCQFLQLPSEQIVDHHLREVVVGGADQLEPLLRGVIATRTPYEAREFPLEYRTPDGRLRQSYWDFIYYPATVPGEDEVEGVLVLATEVSDRIENERLERERIAALHQIAEQKALAERVLDNVPAGVAYLDRGLTFRFANPLYARFINLTPEQIVNRHLDEVLPGAVEQTGPWLHQVMRTGQPFENTSYRLTTYGPGGSETYSYWDFVYYPDEPDADGLAKGVFVLANEISERLRAERERDESQRIRIKALEEGDQLKNQFLGILSHELRTPINAIMGFGSILDDGVAGPLSDAQRRYTSKIMTSADALLALIDDLLVISRVQAGKFTVTPTPVDLAGPVARAVEVLGPAAERKHVRLVTEVAADLPVVDADEQRIQQVVANLLSNAIKFTPEAGQVMLRLRREGGPDGAHLRCEVRDTGIGIAPEDQAKLFKPFSQLDMSNTRASTGTGLGLSIVKAIVEAHGGGVGVASRPGEGSTFWFTLPLPR